MDGRSTQQSRNYKEPEETDCEAGPEGFNCCQHRGFSHPKKVQQQIRSADDSPLHTIPKKRLSKKIQVLVQKMQANHSDFECKLSFGFRCGAAPDDEAAN
jgi:hypothetical protein